MDMKEHEEFGKLESSIMALIEQYHVSEGAPHVLAGECLKRKYDLYQKVARHGVTPSDSHNYFGIVQYMVETFPEIKR